MIKSLESLENCPKTVPRMHCYVTSLQGRPIDQFPKTTERPVRMKVVKQRCNSHYKLHLRLFQRAEQFFKVENPKDWGHLVISGIDDKTEKT